MSAVEWSEGDVVVVDDALIDRVVSAALEEPLRRARLCLHSSSQDPVHEMMIALCCDTEIAPHRHMTKSESFHVIRGLLTVVLYDDEGRVVERIALGVPGGDRPFAYRLGRGRWHTVVVESDVAVIHEVISGPFVEGDAETAPWIATTQEVKR